MSERKELGKIRYVKLGAGGYQDCQFGLTLDFDLKGSGVGTFVCGENLVEELKRFLKEANVDDVTKLKGIPVEITFHNFNVLKEWRILTEVI